MQTATRILWKVATLLLAILIGLAFTLALLADPAHASTGAELAPTPAITFGLDWIAGLNLLVSLVLPAFVAFVTTRLTQSRTKVVLLAGLNALTAALGELLRTASEGATYDAGTALLTFVAGLVVSWLAYDKAWKKAGITSETVGRGRVVEGTFTDGAGRHAANGAEPV
ncbi:hypothetical protein [Pseudactinotalea suaedae]|uniref:hypothetical protein n=1 Tax=Pseudactinotalea suaedae TaxID=1524924 RepID=UPI0012E16827|nr:hypothetical protein [Pseudactinotalea suaedae]